MALPFFETFTGGAGVLPDPPWKQAGIGASGKTVNLDGSGNGKASALDASNDIAAFDDSNSAIGDQYAQLVITGGLLSGSNYAQVYVRCGLPGGAGTFAGYQFLTDGVTGAGHTELWVYSGGSATLLRNFATTFTTGDTMRIEASGTTITCYKNGASLGTQTDSVVATGTGGVGFFNVGTNQVTVDTFEWGALSSSTGATFALPAEPGTWRPPFIQDGRPRTPLGFLVESPRNYVEGPTPAPPPAVRPHITVQQPTKRGRRKVQPTVLAAKTARLTTRIPPKQITVSHTKPAKRKKGVVLVRGAPRAQPAQPKRRKPLVVAPAPRHRKTVKPVVRKSPVVRSFVPPKVRTVVTVTKRRRGAGTTLIVAPLAATVPAIRPTRPITVKEPRRRSKAQGKTVVVRGARRAAAAPAAKPRKPITIVQAYRRKPHLGAVSFLVSPLAAAVAAAVKPKGPVVITAKKRRGKSGTKITKVRKPRTPYITGVTRDSLGTPVPNCQVFVFKTAGEVLVAAGTSDSSGVYLLPVPSYTDNLFVVAYRADSPDIFGTTVNWLVSNA